MKICLSILLLLLYLPAAAQFAVVADKDGYVNVRADAGTGNKITDSLGNGQLVYCFENKENWTNIDYVKKGRELNGYVYKDRYKPIAAFGHIPMIENGKNKVRFKKDSIEIVLTTKGFDKQKHRMSYYKDNPEQIQFIDGGKYWGTDGAVPSTAYDKIIIKTGSYSLVLPAKALYGLFEPNLYSTVVHFDRQTNTIFIQSMNGDGAGGYEVAWKIENGRYIERLVAYGF